MKLFVAGDRGMLGTVLTKEAASHGSPFTEVSGADVDRLDIADPISVRKWLDETKPDWLANCAAYTEVDACEEKQELAMRVNGEGPGVLAAACKERGVRLLHLSSEYVFDGTSSCPYREDDAMNPLSAYGRSKRMGEERVRAVGGDALIVRSQWLYGPDGKHFVDTILRAARSRQELRVVEDQTGSPTYTIDLARALVRLMALAVSGTLHVRNDGVTSWYGFTLEILRLAGLHSVQVKAVASEEYPRPARRPKMAVLDLTRFVRLTGGALRSWQAAVAEYISASGKAGTQGSGQGGTT